MQRNRRYLHHSLLLGNWTNILRGNINKAKSLCDEQISPRQIYYDLQNKTKKAIPPYDCTLWCVWDGVIFWHNISLIILFWEDILVRQIWQNTITNCYDNRVEYRGHLRRVYIFIQKKNQSHWHLPLIRQSSSYS